MNLGTTDGPLTPSLWAGEGAVQGSKARRIVSEKLLRNMALRPAAGLAT